MSESRPRPTQGNDFPHMEINTESLRQEVTALLALASAELNHMGGVNWADLGVTEIEYRISMLRPQDGPHCVVTVEEASPHGELQQWLNTKLDKERFPRTWIECEW